MNDKLNLDSSESNLEKFFRTMIGVLCFNLLILIILFLLTLHYKSLSGNLVGTVMAALITVFGVLIGYIFNKKQTYKEIVTRERIEWLHKMQENLANYLEPTSPTDEKTDSDNEAKDSVNDNKTLNRLYYELIFNINHDKDKDALNALNNYHNARYCKLGKIKVNLALKDGVKLELVLDKGEEDELLFIIKNESERDKLKDLITSDELEKIKISNVNENFDEEEETEKELALLKEEVSKKFTKIFNETWNRIKKEAD